MARDLSAHQSKIVKRYYEQHDHIQSDRLDELLAELWLAEDEKTKTKLWGKAQVALMRLKVDANRVAQITGKRDVEALAELVKTLGRVIPDASAPAGASASASAKKDIGGVEGRAVSVAEQTGGKTIRQLREEKAAQGGFDSLDEDNLKRALKAFRKRLKVVRQDDESRLGGRYTSQGRQSKIFALTPPAQYPTAVWEKLVELKRLKPAGQGMYELPDETR